MTADLTQVPGLSAETLATLPAPLTSAASIVADLRAGRTSARAVVDGALARADALNPVLHAFTELRHAAARAQADAIDDALAAGQAVGPLAGVPVAVKEEYPEAGHVMSLGGRGNSSPETGDAEVIARLRRAGAVVIGRTLMPEFGQWPVGESEHHGTALNPWDTTRSPGGSSSGSAIAVATGIVPVGMGSDGGGSVRIPASACGVVGLKPSRGRVSQAPLAQAWQGMVTFGAITRDAVDAALVLDVIRGNVEGDLWTLDAPERAYTEVVAEATTGASRPLRVLHASNQVLGAPPDPEVEAAVAALAERLAALGHDVRAGRVRWPNPTPTFLTLYAAGMHEESTQVQHPDRLTARTRRTASLGSLLPGRAVRAARRHQLDLAWRLEEAFGSADLILLPTLTQLPCGAHDFAGRGWLASLLASADIIGNTALLNVTGHPCVSVPAGLSLTGVPVGAQLVARMGREDLLLAAVAQLEAAER
ncbi:MULTISPECIES: amidase family protein [unclassified Actinomyces]|uniref:amidase n=1 Tax=unclassified Actinomyces TaxID=2609248 RepID=UPI0020181A48|nr:MULTISPECIES: amidase family protein [unclassified Actinomyces]MCL3778054.1 amidase [Actinomyces sp. AC-20-1]MCL3789860.1 amidase [Actinomyces sp. 187325]MCL3792015.1 amidase [Actinomyces sp. 186855]MCL3794717.1 amidase [Actinomyces sp. 217892]